MRASATKRKSAKIVIANTKAPNNTKKRTLNMDINKSKTTKLDHPALKTEIPSGLELKEGGLRLVSVTFGVTLYTNAFFTEISKRVLGCLERFLQLCPPENLRFYATTNMRMHKPVTKRTLGMLETWLKPGAPHMDLM